MVTGFFKKEIKEFFKTPKFIILISVFLFFAILGPLTAKYMNEIMKMFSTGIEIIAPPPTFKDSWVQFYKNNSSLCMIVFLIIMTNSVAAEKAKGTVMLVLTKKVSRVNFILSKVLAGALVFTGVYIASLLVSCIYTELLFHQVYYSGVIMSVISMWLMGIFLSAFAVFLSILAKSPAIAAIMGFAGFALLSTFNLAGSLVKFNPVGAPSLVNDILQGTAGNYDGLINIITTIIFTAAFLFAGLLIFRKQEI